MNDASTLWTVAFSAALLLGVLTKLYLNGRQVRHVAQHRISVPQAFADRISLAAHQKAADYTLAKSRLATVDLAWSTAVLLGWTLLGGLGLLDQWISASGLGQSSPLLRQVALVAGFALIGGLLDLPLSWYSTFRLEERLALTKPPRPCGWVICSSRQWWAR